VSPENTPAEDGVNFTHLKQQNREPMKSLSIGKLLVTLVALCSAGGSYILD